MILPWAVHSEAQARVQRKADLVVLALRPRTKSRLRLPIPTMDYPKSKKIWNLTEVFKLIRNQTLALQTLMKSRSSLTHHKSKS